MANGIQTFKNLSERITEIKGLLLANKDIFLHDIPLQTYQRIGDTLFFPKYIPVGIKYDGIRLIEDVGYISIKEQWGKNGNEYFLDNYVYKFISNKTIVRINHESLPEYKESYSVHFDKDIRFDENDYKHPAEHVQISTPMPRYPSKQNFTLKEFLTFVRLSIFQLDNMGKMTSKANPYYPTK